MKIVTNQYKEQIKTAGRMIAEEIKYTLNGETITLNGDNLFGVTPSFESSILKSAMKKLEFECKNNIPLNTIISFRFGLKVGSEYEYINYGNYVVYEAEKREETNTYYITCYDKMLYSMKDYKKLDITYPISIRDYINAISTKLGLVFKNATTEFTNFDKMIVEERYLDTNDNSIGYTYRDVLDELSAVTGSTICIDNDDKLEVRYVTETNEVINGDLLKNVNVTFKEKYGPINSVVLSRSGESDNIFLKDDVSITTNGLCEIKIIDNQIMNYNDRDIFLQGIFDRLNGLEYYLNDFESTGITYLDLCDKYGVKIGDTTYPCVLFNDETLITQGLVENIFTDMPTESQTDYSKSDKTDRKINQAYIIVDKQNQNITALASKVEDNKDNITSLEISTESITNKISEQDITINKLDDNAAQTTEKLNQTILDLDGFRIDLQTMQGTITNMNFNFQTDGLSVSTQGSKTNSRLDNTGIKVYNYTTLCAIFNNKGSGIEKLIVTGTAQIGYLRFVKGTKGGKKVTQIFHLDNLIEDLEDLEE